MFMNNDTLRERRGAQNDHCDSLIIEGQHRAS